MAPLALRRRADHASRHHWRCGGCTPQDIACPLRSGDIQLRRGDPRDRGCPPDASHVECVFAGFSPRNTEYIRAAGFEFRLLTPYLSEEEGRLALDFDQGRSLRHPFTARMLAQRVTSERVLLRSLRPDAVVIGVTPSQFISARAECVPLVFVRPFAYSLAHLEAARSTGATGFLPRTSPEEYLVDNVAAHALHALGTRLPLPRSFYSVARANGVSLPQGVLAGLTADLNLIATAPHLLPGWLRMPQGHRVVGPVYARLPGELPEFLAT